MADKPRNLADIMVSGVYTDGDLNREQALHELDLQVTTMQREAGNLSQLCDSVEEYGDESTQGMAECMAVALRLFSIRLDAMDQILHALRSD